MGVCVMGLSVELQLMSRSALKVFVPVATVLYLLSDDKEKHK